MSGEGNFPRNNCHPSLVDYVPSWLFPFVFPEDADLKPAACWTFGSRRGVVSLYKSPLRSRTWCEFPRSVHVGIVRVPP